MKTYLFDAFPLLCWLQEESDHKKVDELLNQAEEGKVSICIQMVNLGEVFYSVCGITDSEEAEEILAKIRMLPISIVSASDSLVIEASRIRGKYPISYANAFTVATAIQTEATILTTDSEYMAVSHLVQIEWLRNERTLS